MRFLLLFFFIVITPFYTFSQTKDGGSNSIRISIKDQKIFNNELPIGTYKKIIIDSELTSLVIYNVAKARVAEATYARGDENWTIVTPVDQNKMYLVYSKEHSFELLFKFLIEKKYL
jgi:hypothetical protein